MIQTWLAGLMTGLSLIVVIGAQNVFVLTHGMHRRNVVVIPLVCIICDAILLSLGIGGLGTVLSAQPLLLVAAAAGGALFLAVYGWRAFRGIFTTQSMAGSSPRNMSTRTALLATLGITLLNPHVYLDTVVLMGSIGSRFPVTVRGAFLVGAVTASALWFFSLSLFGRLLAPVLQRPKTWRVLQIAICGVLWFQAGSLGWFAITQWSGA